MLERDMQQFSETRTKARAYFCYLFSTNLPNHLASISLDEVVGRMKKIRGDVGTCEGIYVLDEKGIQITPTYLATGEKDDRGVVRASRAYYYRAMKEKRCTITDPYPSLITQDMSITVSKPIFEATGELKYVACMDFGLEYVLNSFHPIALHSFIGKSMRTIYALFALALTFISLFLFVESVVTFWGEASLAININDVFQSTILLTLSLAIFDLVKTLFVEEVMAKEPAASPFDSHKTMVRFLGSIIIALSIEALMLVFKFAMTDPTKIINAIEIIAGVGILLIGLAVYIKFTRREEKE
jgi:hypothetical protein